jgi:hypothetical protein
MSHELEVDSRKLEVGVGGYKSTVLNCIIVRRYQATASEDIINRLSVL